MKQWDKIYKKHRSYGAPLKYLDKLVTLFKKYNVRKILDLGCGAGIHSVYLSKNGFDVYGIDISKEAIKTARQSSYKNKVRVNLKVGSFDEKLPYTDSYFDAVISLRVLNHGNIDQIRNIIRETKRILKPKGIIFLTVQKVITKAKTEIRKINHTKVKMINSRTYVCLEGNEKGIIHYIFNQRILKNEFKNFKIKKLWVDYGKEKWERYYYLIGEMSK